MNNAQLKEIISDLVMDEEDMDKIILLDGDEYADGAIGITDDNHVVYDYSKLVNSLMKHNDWSEDDAIEWLNFNTLRAIPYMKGYGKEPIILMTRFSDSGQGEE